MYIFCHYSCLGPCTQSTKVHPDNFLSSTQKEKEEVLLEGIEDDIKEEEKVQSIPVDAPDPTPPDLTLKTEPEPEIKKGVNPLMASGNKWEKPMSHFKAMSLIGKLFMTGKMRKMMANKWGGNEESEPSTSTSSGSYSSGSTSETGSSSSELDSDANDDKAHRDKDTKVNKHDLALVRPRVIYWRNLVESRKAATFRMKYDLIKVRPKAMLWKYNSAKTNKTAKLKLKIVFYRVQSKAFQWRNFATMNRTTHAATIKLRMTFFRIRPKAMHWMNIALNTIAPLTTDHYTKFKLKMIFFKVRPKAMHWMNRPPSITAESIFKLKLAFFSIRPKAMHWMFMALTSTDTTMFMIRKAVFRVRPKAMHWMNSSQVQKAGFQLKVAFYRIRPKAMCWMAQALFKNPIFQMNNEKNGNGEVGGDETDAEAPEIKNEVAEFRDKNEEAEFKEVVDIDISDPFVEQAAIKMQACYRGIRARQQMFLKRMEIEKEEMRKELEDSATLIQATFRGKLARREIKVIKVKKDTEKKEGDEVLNIDLNDPGVANAATKIQASFRGIQARKDIKVMKVNKEVNKTSITKKEVNKAEKEIDDIDPNDPDANNAAIKIQSGFRGSKARKEVQEMKDRMEEEQAATKIQAGFRGIQARKEVQEKKDKLELDKFEQFEQEKAATKIQAGFRGNKARKDVKVIKVKAEAANKEDITDIDLDDEELADAATKIQASFRGSQARKEVKVIKVKTANKEITDGGGQSNDKESNQQKEQNEVEENIENDDDELLEEFTDTSISTSEVSANAPIRNKKHAYKLVKTLVKSAGEEDDAAAKIQAGFRGIQARKEVQEKKDKIEQEQAATKIQAGFRGNKARKDVKVIKVKAEAANKEDITDIDLDDEDLAEAATKIQASFRGSQARKEVKVIKVKSANKDAANDEANVKEAKEDEKDQNDTNENDEDDLLDEFTDTSISTSEVSANAPIRNKKHAYKLVKSLLTSNKIEPAMEVVPPPPKSRLEMRLEQDAKRVDILRPVNSHFRALALLGKMFMAKGKIELKKECSEESECTESENSHSGNDSSRSEGESSQESGYQTHRSKMKSSDLDKIRPRAIYWKNLVLMKKTNSVPPPDSQPKPQETTTNSAKLMTKWNKPISHFKALNLINQLFLSGQMRKMMSDKWGQNKNQETDTESGTETGSETGSSEESDSEGESETGSGSSGSAPSSKKGVTAMFRQMGSMLDSETAATRIQAGYRGHMARKEVVVIKQNAAATRIQAGFRGLRDRNRVKSMKAIEEKEE